MFRILSLNINEHPLYPFPSLLHHVYACDFYMLFGIRTSIYRGTSWLGVSDFATFFFSNLIYCLVGSFQPPPSFLLSNQAAERRQQQEEKRECKTGEEERQRARSNRDKKWQSDNRAATALGSNGSRVLSYRLDRFAAAGFRVRTQKERERESEKDVLCSLLSLSVRLCSSLLSMSTATASATTVEKQRQKTRQQCAVGCVRKHEKEDIGVTCSNANILFTDAC